jgi:hypothetical protein
MIDVGQKLEKMPARQAFLNLFSILPDEFRRRKTPKSPSMTDIFSNLKGL